MFVLLENGKADKANKLHGTRREIVPPPSNIAWVTPLGALPGSSCTNEKLLLFGSQKGIVLDVNSMKEL